ncbi:hypothetical protein D3C75_1195950 [compost metagenome]
MKAKLSQVLYPNHLIYTDAADAMKRYHEALAAGRSSEEIERLRLIAESQFQAVNEYQIKALGGPAGKPH